MKKLATASLLIIILIAGCGASSNNGQNESQKGISITATQPTASEGSGNFIEFVIDIGSPNETAGNIIIYFEASGTALNRNDIAVNNDLQNGYVEIPPGSQTTTIRIDGITVDGIITETQSITLRITGCSSNEYPIGSVSEAIAVVMDGDGTVVTDIDGNVYHTVLIGSQTWMVENLKTSRYRNGDVVTNSWFYNNNSANGNKYGRLYDWYAVSDSRGLAPAGWHIPSDAEWTQLTDYLGGENVAGKKMKSNTGWNRFRLRNGNGTNESGFTAFPGGGRNFNGVFDAIGYYGYFWSSSELDYGFGCGRILYYGGLDILYSYGEKEYGFSVRCVMD